MEDRVGQTDPMIPWPNPKLRHLVLKALVGTGGESLKMGPGRIFWQGHRENGAGGYRLSKGRRLVDMVMVWDGDGLN